jgi:hypothetical protein
MRELSECPFNLYFFVLKFLSTFFKNTGLGGHRTSIREKEAVTTRRAVDLWDVCLDPKLVL